MIISKKFINFDYSRVSEMEEKLEKWAKQGLILHEIGSMMWTFKKDEPKELKYCITFFEKGSRFNPENDEDESLYREYAKESGWDFVDSYETIQVFSSENKDVIPFETDEEIKFECIKKSMNKSFVKPTLLITVVWILNLILQFSIYKSNPIQFLSEINTSSPAILFTLCIITNIYSLINYYIYIRKNEQSLKLEGRMISRSKSNKIVEKIMAIIVLILAVDLILNSFDISNPKMFILLLIQYPIIYFVFKFTNEKLRKNNKSSKVNKVISYLALFIINALYIGGLGTIIINGDLVTTNSGAKYSVEYELYEGEYITQDIYKDDIPIKCEDIYDIEYYKDYSYKKDIKNGILYYSESYMQEPLYKDDKYPTLTYKVIEPKFDFIYNRIVKDQLRIDDEYLTIEKIDNNVFDTIEAYKYKYHMDEDYYNGYIGEYLLLYEDKIISINLFDKVKEEKIDILKQKLLQL